MSEKGTIPSSKSSTHLRGLSRAKPANSQRQNGGKGAELHSGEFSKPAWPNANPIPESGALSERLHKTSGKNGNCLHQESWTQFPFSPLKSARTFFPPLRLPCSKAAQGRAALLRPFSRPIRTDFMRPYCGLLFWRSAFGKSHSFAWKSNRPPGEHR